MSEPIPACISIGGKIPCKLVSALCQAIRAEGLALEWGDAHFKPTSADDLRDACRELEGVNLLWLCDDSANWGRFNVLESVLVENDIAFDLQSDGKAEYDADLTVFRSGGKPIRILTNADGEPMVFAKSLAPVREALEQVVIAVWRGKFPQYLRSLRAAQAALTAALPPAIVPLTPFDVV